MFPQLQTRVQATADQLFGAVFRRASAFVLLYEDSEVDNLVLDLGPESKVLAVSGAGCGIAGLLAAQPQQIDAVDTNRNHLALTAIKVAAAQNLSAYEEFYQLLGHGWHRDAARCLQPLTQDLPDWIGAHWATHHELFKKNLYAEGLAGAFQKVLRWKTGVGEDFLRTIQGLDLDARQRELERVIVSELRSSRLIRAASHSPLFLLGHGINFRQMRRNLDANRTDSMIDVVEAQLQRIAQTNLETNWIAWVGLTGHFNHENPLAVPPYLRAESHARSLHGPTRVNFLNHSLHEALAKPPQGGWSHFSLCDVLDWMPGEVQRDLLVKIAEAAEPGATLLTRSVEMGDIAEDLGLNELYTLVEPLSTQASEQERTGLYGRVNVYRINEGALETARSSSRAS